MVQIAPVKYDKKEGAILARSFLLGIFIGIPLGIFINYLYGFPTLPSQAPASSDIFGWATISFTFFMSLLTVPFTATSIFVVFFLTRQGELKMRQLPRVLWAPILLLIFLPLYISITSAILIPFDFLAHSYALWTLAVTPFVIIFLAVFIPESRVGKIIRRSTHQVRKHD